MDKNIKKKIIISSYDDLKNPVYSGGGAFTVHQLAKRLVIKSDVTVITGSFENCRDEVIDNINYKRIGSHLFGHKIGQILFLYAILRYAINKEYDVWIESTMPPFTFSLLPLFCKKPIVAWINMITSSDMQRKYNMDTKTIERELCKLYKYIIAPTDWVKKEVQKMNKNAKIFTITHGFEDNFLNKPLKRYKGLNNYLLYMGRIEVNQKGLDLLLQTLPYTDKKTKIVIAGSGSRQEEEKLSNLISKYSVAKKVKMIGRVQGKEKEILYRYAKAVIIPSRFETFSITALESIMHQKPVICFDIPQLKWIPGKYAFKINPFNQPELAHCINRIFNSKINKKITVKEKEKYLKKFNWSYIADKFDSCISNIAV